MMFRPEVPMTSRKAVLEEIGRLVIESPPLRTSGGPSRYCADPGGRDILATPEEIAAARCGDCKKLTTLAARRAIDAGAKRVDVCMTVTDEPDEHVFMIVDGEFRDPAREAGMPCRIIDLFIPVIIWPLSEFGKSAPVGASTLEQIRKITQESPMTQDEAELLRAYRQAGGASGTDEMGLALHNAYESPFTAPHREPYFPEAHRAQGPADTLANLGLIDPWSTNVQTQWNIDARAQGPHEETSPVPKSAVASSPASSSAMPSSATPTPKSMTATGAPAGVPAPPAMTPKSMPQASSVSSSMGGSPLVPKSVSSTPTTPGVPASMPHAVSQTAPSQPHAVSQTASSQSYPSHGVSSSASSSPHSGISPSTSPSESTSHRTLSSEPGDHGAQQPGETPHGASPSETHGAAVVPNSLPVGHPAYGGQSGQRWQPSQPPVEGVTRNGGREEWRGGGWVPAQPGHWHEGQLRTASDGTQLIFRRGDWVRGDEPSHVVVFSDGTFRVYCLDGHWHEGHHGDPYPQGYPVFNDVATQPLGSRFSFFVSGTNAYRIDNVTGERFFLGQYLPDHNVLVGWVVYHPRPDGTLEWVGPPAYGTIPQADANLIAYQPTAPVRSTPAATATAVTGVVTANTDIFGTKNPPRFGAESDSNFVAHLTTGTRVRCLESAQPGEGRDRVWYKVATIDRNLWGWLPDNVVQWGRHDKPAIPRISEDLDVFHGLHQGREIIERDYY
jgi:hypothetical protein